MAKKNEQTETTTTPRKPRTPRVLTPLELEAKQQLEDAKSLAVIIPEIQKLGPWGRAKLNERLAEPPATTQVEQQ